MRAKPGLDTFSFDDLYNNLRVFEHDVKGTTASSSNTQNVAFVSTKNTSSTNDVSIAYSVSSPFISKSQKEGSSSYTDEVIHSFFVNQSSAPQLDYDDLEQINDDDMEEMDLKWLVARISMRIKKFHKRKGRKLKFDTKNPVGFDKTKMECFNCHKMGILVETAELKGTKTAEEEMMGTIETKLETMVEDMHIRMTQKLWLPLMERILTGSDNEVKFCSKACEESYARLKKLYDDQRDKLGDASVEITAYTLALKKDTPVNDRFADEMRAVPPPMTENYMPSGPDVEIDYSKFTYGPKQTLADESVSKPSEYASCKSDSSVKTSTSMPDPLENASKVVYEPKVWTDAPIIEEYESDSNNDSVSNVQEDKEGPSFAFIDSVKHVKTSRENVKETGTTNHNPKIEKQDRNCHTRKGLGYAFTRKACFICGSFNHLIRDCDFHEKRMAKQAELTKSKNKDDPHRALKDKGIVDSGCFWHMTRNKAHLADYQEFKGGSVAFGGSNGRIIGKGKIEAGRLDFKDVYYVEELKHYNLFYVSQMCDKKNKVLFADTDCLVLSPDFELPDENQVLLKIPRQHNMYSFNLKNIDSSRDLSCLFAKASIDESNKWHRRLGHVNFKNLNKLVKGNLVRGKGHAWMFDLDYLTNSMNYEPVLVENQANKSAGLKEVNNSAGTQASDNQGANSEEINLNEEHFILNICTNLINTASTPLSTAGPSRAFNDGELSYPDPSKYALPDDTSMPHLEDIYASPSEGIFIDSSYDDEGVISQALEDESWVDAMQEKLLQFQIQKVWILVIYILKIKKLGLNRSIGKKKDERGVVVRNKA
nr:ribonuclease H-like domain-containing protein [Tanacetum cinerariifolium]